ncbi:MAG: hypothetical protein MN733_30205 [Nitrososphaera sp.]|nr:hypothetical protein [Nitrososphaera sp.]
MIAQSSRNWFVLLKPEGEKRFESVATASLKNREFETYEEARQVARPFLLSGYRVIIKPAKPRT